MKRIFILHASRACIISSIMCCSAGALIFFSLDNSKLSAVIRKQWKRCIRSDTTRVWAYCWFGLRRQSLWSSLMISLYKKIVFLVAIVKCFWQIKEPTTHTHTHKLWSSNYTHTKRTFDLSIANYPREIHCNQINCDPVVFHLIKLN